MATLEDVRAICASYPGAIEGEGPQFGFGVRINQKTKGFCWSWLERIHPKKARVVNASVLAIRTPNLSSKELLIANGGEAIFTEPHYDGYPAVLVRLELVERAELEDLLMEAWLSVGGQPDGSP